MRISVLSAVLLSILAAPAAAQDLGAIVASLHAERARYGATMSDEECVELINAVAWKHRADGWGLSGKDFGTHGVRYDGARVAHDILHHRPTNKIWDVLEAAGGASKPIPNLGPGGPPPGSNRPWVAPIVPQGHTEPTPTPTPTPTPAPVDLQPLLDAIKALDVRLNAVVQLLGSYEGRIDQAASEALNAASRASEIKTAIENLPGAQPPPCMVGRVPKGAFGGSTEVRFCPAP